MKQVTAAIIKENNKYLICQRGAADECSLLWEFPGGKLEDGETLEECITREIKEELELDIRLQDIFTTSIYRYDNNEIHFTVFNAVIAGGSIKLNVHNAVKWVELIELKDFSFMPADIEFVEKLLLKQEV